VLNIIGFPTPVPRSVIAGGHYSPATLLAQTGVVAEMENFEFKQ
jgi:hypothetical protein